MIFLFPQIIISVLALSSFAQNINSTGCDQSCGDDRVPYPFGFSDGCKIKLNCSTSGNSRNIKIGDFIVENVTSDQILLSLPKKCNRQIEELSRLFGANFAPTWRNSLLLENCSEPINGCVVPNILIGSRMGFEYCGFRDRNHDNQHNISCYSGGPDHSCEFLDYENVTGKGNCSVLFSSIMVDLNENVSSVSGSSSIALDFQTMELGWWFDGNCDCDPNANCMPVSYQGNPGFRCKCKEGYTGDGFLGGERCRKACLKQEPQETRKCGRKNASLEVILIIVLTTSFAAVSLFLVLICCMKKRLKTPSNSLFSREPLDFFPKISYGDLRNATDGFSLDNLIGSGSFGTVYKGTLTSDGTLVAVKVLNLRQKGASKSFLSECQALRTIRHHNLIKVITACSSSDFHGNDFKALVYQFMRNGSLDKWLHPEGQTQTQCRNSLNILKRIDIAIDVSAALNYLHHQCQTPVIHCDLKPQNILLDSDLRARVGDFGLARLLPIFNMKENTNQFSSLDIKGTIGYAAPEYGMGAQISILGDVYSFGILLLEIFTGKRPTDSLFSDSLSLHHFVKLAIPDKVIEILDNSALCEEETGKSETRDEVWSSLRIEQRQCLIHILQIGVQCSLESPKERMSTHQVYHELLMIRETFLDDRI